MRLCSICKQQIEPEREEAMPDTRLCSEHGRQIEKFGGEFRLSASQERTSKKSSMKVNYGGISTTRTRNDEAIEQLREEYHIQQAQQQ